MLVSGSVSGRTCLKTDRFCHYKQTEQPSPAADPELKQHGHRDALLRCYTTLELWFRPDSTQKRAHFW